MTRESQSEPELVGTVLEGMYRIVGRLGEGGMGAVYDALHLRLQKRVAVKVMARELASNPDALSRFHREAMVTSALGHPHIVQVFDFSSTPTGEPFLVMEFLEGEDLEHRLRRVGCLSPPDTLHVVKQVASALAATHAKGIVHRDLKPANIYLLEVAGATDFVKVLDFGISKVRAATTKLTQATTVMGTPSYMSPEQALGQVDEIDERTDQWALACIAWECLSGQGPFAGENAPSILFQVVHEPPPDLASKVAGLPPAVDEVLRCALAKDKQKRFASVDAFATALEGAMASPAPGRSKSAPVARTERLPDAVASSAPGGSQSTTFTRTAGEVGNSTVAPRSSMRRIWALAGGGAVALSLAAFLLLRPGTGAKLQTSVPVPDARPPESNALGLGLTPDARPDLVSTPSPSQIQISDNQARGVEDKPVPRPRPRPGPKTGPKPGPTDTVRPVPPPPPPPPSTQPQGRRRLIKDLGP